MAYNYSARKSTMVQVCEFNVAGHAFDVSVAQTPMTNADDG